MLSGFIKKYWQIGTAIAVAAIFFACVSLFIYELHHPRIADLDLRAITASGTAGVLDVQGKAGGRIELVKFMAPDESANYEFAKLYAQTGRLEINERYNLIAADIMHPRSIRSDNGVLKPVSFLGMIILYGALAKIASVAIIPYLTPFISAVGIVFLYLLASELFDKRTGLIAAVLLASFPPYIFYSVRSMFHNMPFAAFLIIAAYFLIKSAGQRSIGSSEAGGKAGEVQAGADAEAMPTARNWRVRADSYLPLAYPALAGTAIGLAVSFRTSELIWLLPVLFFAWAANIRRLGLIKPVIILAFAAIALLPTACSNQVLFGSFWKGGYPQMNNSIAQASTAGLGIIKSSISADIVTFKSIMTQLKDTIFYFGLHPRQSHNMLLLYFVRMFPLIFWLGASGVLFWASRIKKIRKRQLVFFCALILATAVLVYYYGSWRFFDNPDKTRATIGNSYTRYWMPIFAGWIVFASYAAGRITRLKIKALSSAAAVLLLLALVFDALRFTVAGSEEGLYFFPGKFDAGAGEFISVVGLTEPESVIITTYQDKLFFPERKVIVGGFDDDNMLGKYAALAAFLPVYYYNFTLPDESLAYLNERRLKNHGLGIEKIADIRAGFTLYRIKPAA